MASFTLLFPLAFPLPLPLSLLGCLDSPPFFISGCFDDRILPTPHFSTRLPYPSSLRPLGSSLWRSGPPQKGYSTPVSRLTPSSIGAHPLSFSPLPFPQFPPSSPHQFCSRVLSWSFSHLPLPTCPSCITSLSSSSPSSSRAVCCAIFFRS